MLTTERLNIVQTGFTADSIIGPAKCLAVNAIMRDEPLPCLIVASLLFVETRNGWVLGHVLIDDEHRRHGYASELVLFYEGPLGEFGACWASESGRVFARRFIERNGPRPLWKIMTAEDDACFNEILKKAKDVRRKLAPPAV